MSKIEERKAVFKAAYWYQEVVDNKTLIHIGGRTPDNKSIHVYIHNFTPFVYVELPSNRKWDKNNIFLFYKYLKDVMKSNAPISYKLHDKYILQYKKKVKVVALTFNTEIATKTLMKKLANPKGIAVRGLGSFTGDSFRVHETNIDSVLKMTAIKKIELSNWISAKEMLTEEDASMTVEERKFTSADIDMHVNWKDVKPYKNTENKFVSPYYCSFDIECYSENHNSKLPNPENKANEIFQISMVFGFLGGENEDRKKILLSLGKPRKEKIGNCDELIVFNNEKDLLLGFTKLIQSYNPDIFIGYNIMKFDWTYMIRRAELLEIYHPFSKLSRIENKPADLRKIRWSSSAYGEQEFSYLECHGRTNVDVLLEVERNYRLPKYTLDVVSEKFLGKRKEDVSPRALFMLYQLTIEILPIVSKPNSFNLTEIKNRIIEIFPSLKCSGIVKDYRKRLLSSTVDTIEDLCIEAMEITGKYCVQDTILPIDLAEKLNLWTTMEEMSNVTNVPVSYLHTRGQQIKVVAQVFRETLTSDIVIPYLKRTDTNEKYQGAIVVEANKGDYKKVATLDFASLYPTVMIAFNICYTTILEDDDPTPDEECHVIAFSDHIGCEHDPQKRKRKKEDVLCKDHRYRFRKVKYSFMEDGTVERKHEGVLPKLERRLLSERKVYKKEMFKVEARLNMHRGTATPNDIAYYKKMNWEIIEPGSLGVNEAKMTEITYNVLNAKQLAVKVSANSAYGAMGVQNGMMPLIPGAASVTAMGRMLITMAIDKIKKEYSFAKLVYGDSVANYTPVYVRRIGGSTTSVDVCTIEELADKYGSSSTSSTSSRWLKCEEPGKQTKEYCEFENVEAWTEQGWTKLHRVIRHKLAEHKKMVRILTHTGMVDVTDDHSLLRSDGSSVSPKEVETGTELLHRPIVELYTNKDSVKTESCSIDEAKIYGFFFGDGSCGVYNCPSGNKYSWALNNADMNIITKYLELCKKVYPLFEWKFYDTLKSSGVYKISFNSDDKKQFITDYRENTYYNKCKIIPSFILNGNENVRKAFWEGLYDADGEKDNHGYTRLDQKNQISASHICLLAQSIGYKTSISTRNDKPNIYRITCTKRSQRKNPVKVKKIDYNCLKDYDDYVYDLTTENHHFAAGIGNMIVHNTDSCMIHFENKDLSESFELAEEASEVATHHLKCHICNFPEDYEIKNKSIKEWKSSHEDFEELEYNQKCNILNYESCPIDLEFENMYGRFLLLTKKRYVAHSVNKKGDLIGVTKKGVVLTRRDNSKYLRDTYQQITDGILENTSEKDVMMQLYDRIHMLFTKQIPTTHLIIYVGVKSIINYAKSHKVSEGRTVVSQIPVDKNGEAIEHIVSPLDPRLVYPNIPQVLLSLKMMRRGEEIPPNTRLEFIYIENPEAEHQGEKAEDYTYYKENKDYENMKPDYLHYLEKQLTKPVTELLTVKYPKGIIPYISYEDKFRQYMLKLDSIHRCKIANASTYSKNRPLHGLDVYKSTDVLVGWNALENPIKEEFKRGSDLKFEKYLFKKDIAKITCIIDDVVNNTSTTSMTKEKYPDLFNLALLWKSQDIIDKLYKKFGLTKRKWKKPTYVGEKLRVNTEIIMMEDRIKDNVKQGDVGKIIDLHEETCPYSKTCDYKYDILFDERRNHIAKNVPRKTFTTFIRKDATIMKDIFSYRENHRHVVNQIKLFSSNIVIV